MNDNLRESEEIERILKDILGERELLLVKMILGEIGSESAGYYKNISNREPKINTRDILNIECALSKGIVKNKKLLEKMKKYLGKPEILIFTILRLRNYSLEEIEHSLTKIQEQLRGERIYLEGRRKIISELCVYISYLLSEKYSMNNKEVGDRLGKSKETARRYLMRSIDISEWVFGDIIEDLYIAMDKHHDELIKRQNNKLFIRHGKNSKKYSVIDMSKDEKDKNREIIASEKEVEDIINNIENIDKKSYEKICDTQKYMEN